MKILQKECKSFKIIEYLKENIDKETIEKIINILNIDPVDLIRKNEKEFKKSIDLLNQEDSNSIIKLIIKYPKIMERPIIINKNKGVIGRPPENIYKIL